MLAEVVHHAYFTIEQAAKVIGVDRERISTLIANGKLHKVQFQNVDRVSHHELAMLSPNDFLGLSLVPAPSW